MSRKGTPYSSRTPSRSPSSEKIRGRYVSRGLAASPKLRRRHKSATPSPRSRSGSQSRSQSRSSSTGRSARRCCRSVSRSPSRSLSRCRRCCRSSKRCQCMPTCCLGVALRRLCRVRRKLPPPTPSRSTRPKPVAPALVHRPSRRRRWKFWPRVSCLGKKKTVVTNKK
ncbi:hypothetical protein MPTK1_8g05140 [Marchantia polymorpha subsp. ruderalis]|uniref:Uncharacterized protein n=1 Tax=Marchantia polymorpha TaxID=3197 RepID=A0A2R6WKA0_MARPO|nr:hypothetical protein MARPO_0081s0015 [Marchantia polymorpha]BBN18746.1 hypothetical protein Mp_8g05140 [Marchantia polymorpha subsp. ruderalis]|eukprot:PTQ34285.1 hypothetical protein MARPO_0081s0015 [Marchantia polymorpha]